MKSLKKSFAVIVAVAAIGSTIAANASMKPLVTSCFTQIVTSLGNVNNGESRTTADPKLNSSGSKTGQGTIIANPATSCVGSTLFCCATLTANPGSISQVFYRN